MTTYDVRHHREIVLTFYDIKADSPEQAAEIAREADPDKASTRVESDDLYAQVSVSEGEPHPPVTLVFEAGRSNQAASKLLAALKSALEFLETNDDGEEDVTSRIASAHAAIAEAEATGISPAPSDIDIHVLLAKRRQIAVVWSVEDVQEVRPGLTDDQCWEVLQQANDQHDAGNGISWDVLEFHAEMLFGSAPETDEAEEA
jgi:hypothetical protein